MDGKHTVFGKLVGGMDTLNVIEQIGAEITSEEPREPVWFIKSQVFYDPFEVAEAELQKERAALARGEKPEEKTEEEPKLKPFKSGVGRYIAPNVATQKRPAPVDKTLLEPAPVVKKKLVPRSTMGDFSSW